MSHFHCFVFYLYVRTGDGLMMMVMMLADIDWRRTERNQKKIQEDKLKKKKIE